MPQVLKMSIANRGCQILQHRARQMLVKFKPGVSLPQFRRPQTTATKPPHPPSAATRLSKLELLAKKAKEDKEHEAILRVAYCALAVSLLVLASSPERPKVKKS